MTTTSIRFLLSFPRIPCLSPQDVVFNWSTKKDLPGTSKLQIPRIVVTPPAPTTNKFFYKRKKRLTKTSCHRAAPSKLILGPGFWSPQPETPRERKRRCLFKCRNAECTELFSTTRQREMHEGHCFTFNKVHISNPCINDISLNHISGVQFMHSFFKT